MGSHRTIGTKMGERSDTEGFTSEQVVAKCEEKRNKGKFDLDLRETIKIELE